MTRHTRHTAKSGTSGRNLGSNSSSFNSSRREESNEPCFEGVTLKNNVLQAQMYQTCVAGTS